MANIPCRFKTLEDMDKDFMSSVEMDKTSKCWVWKNKVFRFRHDYLIFNPRRYALQMEGYVIPKGRNLYPDCGNPMCVNPEHARMKHDGTKVPRGLDLYFDLGTPTQKSDIEGYDFQYSNKYLGKKYHVSVAEASKARRRTLELIVTVRQSRLPVNRLANMYGVSPSYINRIKELTVDNFETFKENPNEDTHDDETINPDGYKFKL